MRGKRMIVYVGEGDRWHHQPLHLAILRRLRKEGFLGATVTHGIAGYGQSMIIKTDGVEVAVELPMVVTAVDTPERVEALVPEIAAMLAGGLLTVEDVDIRYSAGLFKVGFPDRRVGDVMSKDPEVATPDAPLAEVVRRLVERDYTALPVVDADRRVLGMIDEADLLEKGLTELSLSLHKVIGAGLVGEYLARLAALGTTVRAAMRATPTVHQDQPLRAAGHVMHVGKLKRLPVVDENGRLVGMIARLDLLASLTAGHPAPSPPHEGALPARHARVADIMDPSVPVVGEEAPLSDVLDKLLASGTKRVVVSGADGRPAGIITDTDLVARVDPEDRPGLLTLLRSRWSTGAEERVRKAHGQRAADVMSRPVISVRDDAPISEALALTVTRHVKRLPVVDAEGRLVGMVSRPALLAAALDVAAPE